MTKAFRVIPVIFNLGLQNILTVVLYRWSLRSGLIQKITPIGQRYSCDAFVVTPQAQPQDVGIYADEVIARANNLLNGRVNFFAVHDLEVGDPPDWFKNHFTGTRMLNVDQHWSKIGDFSSGAGDIKTIWELSRFGWAIDLARAYRVTNDIRFLDGLNRWISDWTMVNRLNCGPNWKCGQETALRMLHLLLAAYLLDQHSSPSGDLIRFVSEHCRRIEPTLFYALAQNNNHGTSEAAALFVGGTWLLNTSTDADLSQMASRWQRKGRRWLEDRAERLIQDDGTFSQYSIVYHRLLVDTLNMVEFWRRELGAVRFSGHFYKKAKAAVEWLFYVTDPVSGDAPNLGANDGTQLFHLSSAGYRDFRPSIQLGAALFLDARVYPDGFCDEPLAWLKIDTTKLQSYGIARASRSFPRGGYLLLARDHDMSGSWALVRYSNFLFRPNHADCLHFDLWSRGVNILRDSGSFSYNTDEPWQSYFSSTHAHNTVELDGRDQMLRLSKFLRGTWLRMHSVADLQEEGDRTSWSGSYTDYQGAHHERTVECDGPCWKITDNVYGYTSKATLRWRLAPGVWELVENRCLGELAELVVDCNEPISRSEIVEGWESRYYWQKSTLPVWEIEVNSKSAEFSTYINLRE